MIQFRVLITTSGRQAGHHSSHVYVRECCIVTDKCSGSVIIFVHRVYVHRYTYVVKETRKVNRPGTPCVYTYNIYHCHRHLCQGRYIVQRYAYSQLGVPPVLGGFVSSSNLRPKIKKKKPGNVVLWHATQCQTLHTRHNAQASMKVSTLL